MRMQHNVPLAPFTTLGLGGPARRLVECRTARDIREAITRARKQGDNFYVLGGGSNVVFPDETVEGTVIKIAFTGVTFQSAGEYALVTAKAGEPWDKLVVACVDRGLSGLECLSGIPGSVGAAPIQNVGAYGREASDTIAFVKALDAKTLSTVKFSNKECGFGYRTSRFKTSDRGRFIITAVGFHLKKNGAPTLAYEELSRRVKERIGSGRLGGGRRGLSLVREIVLALRREKSMLFDLADANSRSCGSFFLNPVLSRLEFKRLERQYRASGGKSEVLSFPSGGQVKIPAAWLLEQAGWRKGYSRRGAGISEHHVLSLVNRGGTSRALLALARDMQKSVHKKFGIRLELEPVVIDTTEITRCL